MRTRSSSKGFTLIELLIVVAIIGIIAAIAIPNLLNAIQRGKQKRTMSDMRSSGTAVESYKVDNGFPPVVGNGALATVQAQVAPTYIKALPIEDGWKFGMFWVHSTAVDDYSVVSYGKDKVSDAPVLSATTDFKRDIFYADGQFSQYPDGTQN